MTQARGAGLESGSSESASNDSGYTIDAPRHACVTHCVTHRVTHWMYLQLCIVFCMRVVCARPCVLYVRAHACCMCAPMHVVCAHANRQPASGSSEAAPDLSGYGRMGLTLLAVTQACMHTYSHMHRSISASNSSTGPYNSSTGPYGHVSRPGAYLHV